jgi:hypothetical protein
MITYRTAAVCPQPVEVDCLRTKGRGEARVVWTCALHRLHDACERAQAVVCMRMRMRMRVSPPDSSPCPLHTSGCLSPDRL